MDKPIGRLKVLTKDGEVVDAILYCHQETITIGGTTYYLLKLDTPADASGTTLSASTGSVARVVWGKFVFQLTGKAKILSATIYATYRAYTGGGTVNAEIDIKILKSDGTVRTTIATGVSKSANLGSSWATYTGANYSFAEYTVVDASDYLEIDYIANVTAKRSGQYAYLRIDDNTLALANQTRSQEWSFSIGVAYTITLTDSIGLLDTSQKGSAVFKADRIVLLDTYSRMWSKYIALTDSIGLLDTAQKLSGKTQTDNIALLDTVAPLFLKVVTLADAIGLLDTAQKLAYKIQFDKVALLDTVKKESSLVKADKIGLLDTLLKMWSAHITLADSIGLTDAVKKLASKTQSDKIGLLDTYTRVWTAHITITDKIGLLDTIVLPFLKTVLLSDAIGLLDTYSRIWTMYKTVTDSVGLADAVQKAAYIKRIDSVGLLDTYSRVDSEYRTLVDSIGLKDSVAPSFVKLLELSEKIALVDKAYKLRVAKFRRMLRPSRILGSVRELEREREEPGRVE
jgi:hypothetical protein